MKNVPNIRLFSRIYTKKIHLSYFTFDSVIRTAYTYNSIKKNNRFRFVFNSNINQKYIGKVLVHEHSWKFMNFYERFMDFREHSWKFMKKFPLISMYFREYSWTKKKVYVDFKFMNLLNCFFISNVFFNRFFSSPSIKNIHK